MIGNSLLGNRQLGEAEIGTRAPMYYTVRETITKSDTYTIGVSAVQNDTLSKTETFFANIVAVYSETLSRLETMSALVNGSPVSLIWTKVAKVITTLWNKIPKP